MKDIGLNIACVCGVSHRNWYLQDYYTLMFHFSAKDELVIHTLNTISSKSASLFKNYSFLHCVIPSLLLSKSLCIG